jgi:quinol monooxygenase YgiN
MVHLSLALGVPPASIREVSDALRALARRARRDSACASSDVFVSIDNQGRLVLQQDWTAEADLARYVRSDDFTQVLTLIEMATEPPVLEFDLTRQKRGLDYVAEVRRGA